MVPYRECPECHVSHYYDPQNDPACDECFQDKEVIALAERVPFLVPYRSCEKCNEPIYYNPSEDSHCGECGRTKAAVSKQARNPGLHPYGFCEECFEPKFFKPNKNYVEEEEDFGTILTRDCFYENWDSARQRVILFPKEAIPLPRHADSALHFAVSFRAPYDVIKMIAMAYPRAISSPNDEYYGWTPLHALLSEWELDDEAIMTFKMIQRLDPHPRGLELENMDGDNCFHCIWDRIRHAIDLSLKRGSSLEKDPHPFLFRIEEQTSEFRAGWDILCHAYRATYYKKVRHGQSTLRALVGCRIHRECPDMALRFAIKVYPGELERASKQGNLPLHIAAKSKQWARAIPDDCSWYESVPHPASRTPYKAEQIRILVEASPKAARVRNLQGSLPLHLAIKAGRKWDGGIKSILEAYPAAVIGKDGECGLFPFMLAAVFANERECCDSEENDSDDEAVDHTVDLTYRLLRTCPELDRFGDWRQQSGVRDASKLAKVTSLLSCLMHPLRRHSRSKEGV